MECPNPKCRKELRRVGHRLTCVNPKCHVIVAYVERKGKLEPNKH